MNAKATILVVEDDLAIREMIQDTLELEGYHVVYASNGVEGLHVATRIHCDLILVDMYMPLMDGKTFLSRYQRKAMLHAPIIVTSAQHVDPNILRGVAGFIRKPFNIDDLLGTIVNILHKRKFASA